MVHGKYQCATFAYDIALLKVEPIFETPKHSTTKFPPHIKPIALPCQKDMGGKNKRRSGRIKRGSGSQLKQKGGIHTQGRSKGNKRRNKFRNKKVSGRGKNKTDSKMRPKKTKNGQWTRRGKKGTCDLHTP